MIFFRPRIVFFVLLFLNGCASYLVPLVREQTIAFEKGVAVKEVDKALGKATMKISHEFEMGGRRYIAKHYSLKAAVEEHVAVVCAPTCIPVMYGVDVLDPYVVVIDNETGLLVIWGTLEELSRHP